MRASFFMLKLSSMSNKSLIYCLAIALAVMVMLQIPNRMKLGDPDGFYHAKASQLLAKGELTNSFPHLAYTTWKDGYADQHYLYHFLLIPFNNIDFLFLSVIVFALIAVAAFYFLFAKFEVRFKWWWILLLMLGSTDFLFRINLVKANTLSLAFLASIMMLILWWRKTHKSSVAFLIGLASMLFVWTYGGFVFVPVLIGLYVLAVLIFEKKFDYIPALASAFGLTLGLLLHPHGSHLMTLLYDQIFKTGLGAGSMVPAGNEWLSFNMDWFLRSNIPVLIIWSLSLMVSVWDIWRRKISWQDFWVQSISIVLLYLTLRHRRFIEYFVPFIVLASAVVLSPYLLKIKWAEFRILFYKYWQFGLPVVVILIIMLAGFGFNLKNVYVYLEDGENIHRFEEASKIISSQSKLGDIVIDTQWDQFPQLFYWNSKNYYPVGLDPTFMYIYDQNLYWDWREIADDDDTVWETPGYLHRKAQNLKAKFIFVDYKRNNTIVDYLRNMDQNEDYFKQIYDRENVVVYQVMP
jgi:hypothetical protein